MNKISFIEIVVGSLPEWYLDNESYYDFELEDFLLELFNITEDNKIKISYGYNGPMRVILYNQDDDIMTEFTMNIRLKDVIERKVE